MIREMGIADIQEVVHVHQQSFPGFFLSFLGPRFLTIYYAAVCASAEGICFVFLNTQGVPAGFVVGTTNPRGFYSRLLKRDGFKFALASLTSIIKRPSAFMRLVRALFYPGGNPIGDDVAGLFSIGVLPGLQGTGAGKELARCFLQKAADRGCKRVFLTTDRDDNEAVNAFYQKLGFSVERQYETPEGRRMNEYWINLADKEADHA